MAEESAIDWNICCLYKVSTDEKLQHPTRGGYETIADNVQPFNELNALPL